MVGFAEGVTKTVPVQIMDLGASKVDHSKRGFAKFLLDAEVLKFGDFTLKDGSFSPFFLDFGALSRASSFRQLGEHFAGFIEQNVNLAKVDFLYGPPYKAVMLAGATALGIEQKDLPCFFSRKEPKAHGEGGNSFGHQPQAGQGYVLIDDVMSSGGTKLEALELLSDCHCRAVVVGVDRQHKIPSGLTAAEDFTKKTGVPVYGLIGLGDLCQSLEGLIAVDKHQRMSEFCGVS